MTESYPIDYIAGTGPMCDAGPQDCDMPAYVYDGKVGSGCISGWKAKCKWNPLDWKKTGTYMEVKNEMGEEFANANLPSKYYIFGTAPNCNGTLCDAILSNKLPIGATSAGYGFGCNTGSKQVAVEPITRNQFQKVKDFKEICDRQWDISQEGIKELWKSIGKIADAVNTVAGGPQLPSFSGLDGTKQILDLRNNLLNSMEGYTPSQFNMLREELINTKNILVTDQDRHSIERMLNAFQNKIKDKKWGLTRKEMNEMNINYDKTQPKDEDPKPYAVLSDVIRLEPNIMPKKTEVAQMIDISNDLTKMKDAMQSGKIGSIKDMIEKDIEKLKQTEREVGLASMDIKAGPLNARVATLENQGPKGLMKEEKLEERRPALALDRPSKKARCEYRPVGNNYCKICNKI